MNCPICSVELQMAERQGIEIDYCPKCRGVWLDRGELDKIIERSGAVAQAPGRESSDHYRDERREHDNDDDDHHRDEYRHGRRRSMLKDLFDF